MLWDLLAKGKAASFLRLRHVYRKAITDRSSTWRNYLQKINKESSPFWINHGIVTLQLRTSLSTHELHVRWSWKGHSWIPDTQLSRPYCCDIRGYRMFFYYPGHTLVRVQNAALNAVKISFLFLFICFNVSAIEFRQNTWLALCQWGRAVLWLWRSLSEEDRKLLPLLSGTSQGIPPSFLFPQTGKRRHTIEKGI